MLLSWSQALTSNSFLPHSCWAICSDDQSHIHTCCKFHSALTWHSCQRKGGISVAAPAHYCDFSVTQTQGDTAAEILVIVSKPSASGVLHLPKLIWHCWTTIPNTTKFAFQCTALFLIWRLLNSCLNPFSSSTELDLNACPPSISCYWSASSQTSTHTQVTHC